MNLTHPNVVASREAQAIRTPTRRGGVLKGCLIAAGVLLVILVGAGIYASMNWRSWTAGAAKFVAEAAITGSQLPPDVKSRVQARVNSVTDDFKAGKITADQFGNVLKEVSESPFLPVAMALSAEKTYFPASKLSDEEKSQGVRSLQRFARGVSEKKIPAEAIQQVMGLISNPQPGGGNQPKASLTDDELRGFLAAVKSRADSATIPDESYAPNLADEFDKAVDAALKR